MSSRCSSAPRMREVHTARVKDGRYSNEKPINRPHSAARVTHLEHYNPEMPNPPANKISPIKAQRLFEKKLQIDNVQTAPSEQANKIRHTEPTLLITDKKPLHDNKPPKDTKQLKGNKQTTIYGRKLEYPAEQRRDNKLHIQTIPNERVETEFSEFREDGERTVSLSKHFVDRSVKSTEIKNKRRKLEEKFNTAFGYLLETNGPSLAERRRACIQKARPKDELFRIERPHLKTTYESEFPPKRASYDFQMEPQNEKTALGLKSCKVCGNSTTQEFHNGKYGPRVDLATWPDGFKLQGPMCSTTTYGVQETLFRTNSPIMALSNV